MTQKTVRFYPESRDDMTALDKLNDYRSFGFSSARKLIIAAINAYKSRESVDVDELAERIFTKLMDKKVVISEMSNSDVADDNSCDEVYDRALDFISSL